MKSYKEKVSNMAFDFTKEPGRVLLDRQLNTEGTPLVSIITPYYNAGTYFEQTFNCVMNQTFPWFEWIIVNDGSTKQEDVALVEQLAATDKRVRVLHKENGGISTARNMGIKDAKTDIIIPLDADDLIVPTFVEVLYWGLYYNPEYTWCYTDNVGFQNQEYLWRKPFDAELLKTYNFLTYCGAIRKSALLEVGCYDEITKHYFEDWRTWLKLLSKSMKPVKASMYGFWYRRLDTGVLSIVTNDKETKALADKLISEAAKTADGTVKAKEYPAASKVDQFIKPKVSTFDRKVFKKHDKINVMMLIPWMEMGGADLFNLDVVKRIDKERFEISILSTVAGESIWRQRFEEYAADIFELPTFLDIENYA
ncbi:MAG: glycosyltransferase family 2 protein, partial [Peptococcaceae bacterium]|nr:glycosyltransferase family 2 protein [Peptococcaceae bacterium]